MRPRAKVERSPHPVAQSQANAAPRQEIRPLTGIRGVAACLVVVYHYLQNSHNYFQNSTGLTMLHAVLFHGYIAVDLFFVLSGLVMALNYAGQFSSFSWNAYITFMGKRLGRVYPLYLFITLVAAVLLYAGKMTGVVPTAAELFSNILMVQAWGVAASIDDPAWSISTEFAAYLLFPVLVTMVMPRSRGWFVSVLGLAVLTLVFVATRSTAQLYQFVDNDQWRSGPLDVFGVGTPYPLMRCLGSFTLGLAAARLVASPAVAELCQRRYVGDIAFLAMAALWVTPGSDVLLVIAFVPLVMTLCFNRSAAAWVLGTRPVHWLGEVSYSIYLVHRPLERLLRQPLVTQLAAHHVPHAYTLAGIVPTLLTFLVSAATFYWIEKPARDLSRRLMRLRPTAGAEPAPRPDYRYQR